MTEHFPRCLQDVMKLISIVPCHAKYNSTNLELILNQTNILGQMFSKYCVFFKLNLRKTQNTHYSWQHMSTIGIHNVYFWLRAANTHKKIYVSDRCNCFAFFIHSESRKKERIISFQSDEKLHFLLFPFSPFPICPPLHPLPRYVFSICITVAQIQRRGGV